MKKLFVYIPFALALAVILSLLQSGTAVKDRASVVVSVNEDDNYDSTLYDRLDIGNIVNYDAFRLAMHGHASLEAKNKDLIVIIDFSKPSTEERLCVIDLSKEKVLHVSHVAHGRNSGGNYATSFSNKPGSYQSSLGFYVTENTYQGKNGYSLVLNGLEKGINDKAKERAIVIHGADYCNPQIVQSAGRLGRSFGCPALPKDKNAAIINTIKNGVLLFIYAPEKSYLEQSSVI